jgi:hypothetical protein
MIGAQKKLANRVAGFGFSDFLSKVAIFPARTGGAGG